MKEKLIVIRGLLAYWPLFFLFFVLACSSSSQQSSDSDQQTNDTLEPEIQTAGSFSRLDSDFNQLVPEEAVIEIIGEGFDWAEGPLWLGNSLIFSDVPANTIYKWTETAGISKYLSPSGYLGTRTDKREPGSNGLALDPNGRLILCQHGERQVGRMASTVDKPIAAFAQVVNLYNGKRLNSPNDLTFRGNGEFYFTDPPYGLDEWDEKQLDFQGVYHVDSRRNVTLLVDSLSRPNGIALSPDEKTLYVAVSDPKKAIYYAYDLDDSGMVVYGRILLDVTNMVGPERPGVPDGLKVDKRGYLWATGPGGVLVISPEGDHLGTIETGVPTSNCAFNSSETVLFITADMYLMRVQLVANPT